MRIACLQFAPRLGDIDNNLNRADAILSRADPKDLDLLVLPELAFTGYNFKSLKHISPYLEPTAAGITSLWARTAALKYDCIVTVGYPEKVDITAKWPASPEYYNSAITVSAEGETIANYRKTFLFYSDETWALEGADGFFDGEIPGLGNVAMGICKWPTKDFERMDLNPYKFEAPWNAWEFAYHILHKQANVVIISMAWLTLQDASSYSREPMEPDMETLSYWIARLEPVIRAEGQGEIIVILANRCGVEDEAVYAGTSCVLGVENGEVKLYGILGRGEKELLIVDTSEPPHAKLIQDHEQNVPDGGMHGTIATNGNSIDWQGSEMPSSIDAVLAENIPVSPVSSRAHYGYFNSSHPAGGDVLSNLKSSVGIKDSFSPITTGFSQSPIPEVQRPTSPKSRNSSRSRTEPVIAEKRMKELEITSVVDFALEPKDPNEPNSASSLKVNTPWEKTSGFFRAEDVTFAINSTSPKPANPPTPSATKSPMTPLPSPPIQGNSIIVSHRSPVANGSRSPNNMRDPSHSGQNAQRFASGLGISERTNNIPKSPIAMSVVEPSPALAQDQGSGTTPSPSRSTLPQPRETPTSPRPQNTIW